VLARFVAALAFARLDPYHPIMPCSLRSATAADVPLILELIRDLADYEKLAHEVVATEEALRRTLFGPTPAAHVVIAEVDGQPAGFALYFFNYSTFLAKPGLYLEDLFVKPEYRGAGTGKALLLHLAKLANTRGCGRMEWSVLDWNHPAKGFYRKLGAAPLDDWRIMRLTGPALAQYR
jgi:GNAT superfamily N-acetyltransferase